MITNPKIINNDLVKQEIFCVCCNNKIAEIHESDFRNLRFMQHNAKVNGFDLICYSCVQKLKKGRRLYK